MLLVMNMAKLLDALLVVVLFGSFCSCCCRSYFLFLVVAKDISVEDVVSNSM